MAALPCWHAPCVNCGNTATSKWRGPNKDLCSGNKCKDVAAAAFAALRDSEKDQQIAELKAQVRELATTVAVLRGQRVEAQKPSTIPAVVHQPQQHLAKQPAKQPAKLPANRLALTDRTNLAHPAAPAAKRPKPQTQIQPSEWRMPQGWSSSYAGNVQFWRWKETRLSCDEQPALLAGDGRAWLVQHCVE
jgi:hypothetical protein